MRPADAASRTALPLGAAALLWDERGAATIHWVTVGALLLFAALLAYPDLTYDLDRALYRYGIDVHIPWIWN